MGILLTKKDIIWLKENFEDLKIIQKPLLITWRLCFNYSYKDIPICDSYTLCIKQDINGNITVFEVWNKILKIAQILSMPIKDLHINDSWSLCLSIAPIKSSLLWNNYSIVKYIETLVVPFLYATTYLYKYKKRPWWEYEHGILWYLAAYANEEINYPIFKRACCIFWDPCKIKFPFSKN